MSWQEYVLQTLPKWKGTENGHNCADDQNLASHLRFMLWAKIKEEEWVRGRGEEEVGIPRNFPPR